MRTGNSGAWFYGGEKSAGSGNVASLLICLYAGAGLVTAIATYLASRRIAKFPPSRTVRIVASVVAGAIWPLVLLGLAQAAVVVLYVKYAKPREQPADAYSESVDARF
jgi:hypothetical protein